MTWPHVNGHGCWVTGADRVCEDGTKGCSREHADVQTITHYCNCTFIRDIRGRTVKRGPGKDCPVHAPCPGDSCDDPHCPVHLAIEAQQRATEAAIGVVKLPGKIEQIDVEVHIEGEACGTCGTRAVVARRCGFCGARA